jgi:hypothetical protein
MLPIEILIISIPSLILLLCCSVMIHNIYLAWVENAGTKYTDMYYEEESGIEIAKTHHLGLPIRLPWMIGGDSNSETDTIFFTPTRDYCKYGGITSESEGSDTTMTYYITISPREVAKTKTPRLTNGQSGSFGHTSFDSPRY